MISKRNSIFTSLLVFSGFWLVFFNSAFSQSSVTWQNAVNVTISGNTITKTTPNGWGAGASSVQSIPSGYNGYVEFGTTNNAGMAGLSNGDSNAEYPDIDYAIQPGPNYGLTVAVYEKGIYQATSPIVSNPSDVFRVALESGVVKYYHNGTLIYTSTQTPVFPLLFDTALYANGGQIQNGIIASSPVIELLPPGPQATAGNCPAPLCIDNVSISPTTNGATITWTTNIAATSVVDYWLNARNVTTVNASTSSTTTHSVTISGLSSGFLYGFKITANASGFSPSAYTSQFTTQAPTSPCSDPVCISGVAVSGETQTSAIVTWTTDVPATSEVEYGLTTRYGNTTPLSGNLVKSHRVTLTSLNPGSVYNFRTISTASGFPARSSNDQFSTQSLPCSDPVCIINLQATPTADGAVITWTTNIPADSQVKYNTRPIFTTGETRSTPVDSSLTVNHSTTLSGLNPGYTYYAQANSSGGGNTAKPVLVQFNVGGSIGGGGQPGIDQPISWRIFNPLKGMSQTQNVFDLIIIITDWILNIAGSLIIILIIYSGVRFLISRGNPGEIQKAKSILFWAIVGFGVILIGKGFIYLIESVLQGQKIIFP